MTNAYRAKLAVSVQVFVIPDGYLSKPYLWVSTYFLWATGWPMLSIHIASERNTGYPQGYPQVCGTAQACRAVVLIRLVRSVTWL